MLVLLTASGAAGYFLIGAVRHPAGLASQPTTSPAVTSPPGTTGSASATASAAAGKPTITGYSSYQQGSEVFFQVRYTNPGHDATGFGFAGADGSSLAEQNHTFVQPGDGVVTANSVAYPVQQCGTSQRSSSVKVWITYTGGARSNSVTVPLACAG